MSLESSIDDLYRLPLAEFTAERNALAKTLTGDDAKRVKALVKPSLLPWVANQLYWQARPVHERLMKSGVALRSAQIAALEGRGDALSRATDAHRHALAEAVRAATELAARHGAKPGADDLSRMLDALSLAPNRPDPPGRLTELVQPAGFEALAGVTPAPREHDKRPAEKDRDRESRKQDEETRRREHEARLKAAERDLERAKEAEAAAEEALAEARKERKRAEAALDALVNE